MAWSFKSLPQKPSDDASPAAWLSYCAALDKWRDTSTDKMVRRAAQVGEPAFVVEMNRLQIRHVHSNLWDAADVTIKFSRPWSDTHSGDVPFTGSDTECDCEPCINAAAALQIRQWERQAGDETQWQRVEELFVDHVAAVDTQAEYAEALAQWQAVSDKFEMAFDKFIARRAA